MSILHTWSIWARILRLVTHVNHRNLRSNPSFDILWFLRQISHDILTLFVLLLYSASLHIRHSLIEVTHVPFQHWIASIGLVSKGLLHTILEPIWRNQSCLVVPIGLRSVHARVLFLMVYWLNGLHSSSHIIVRLGCGHHCAVAVPVARCSVS